MIHAIVTSSLAPVVSPATVITIDDFWLTFLVATILPAVTAFITKRYASSMIGALVLLFLSVVTGWATSLGATDGTFEIKAAVTGIFVAFITAVVSHFGLLKPANITGSGGIIQELVPGGIGSSGTPRA